MHQIVTMSMHMLSMMGPQPPDAASIDRVVTIRPASNERPHEIGRPPYDRDGCRRCKIRNVSIREPVSSTGAV